MHWKPEAETFFDRDRYLLIATDTWFLFRYRSLFCTPMTKMRLYVERISEKNRELRRILENFGEGPLEKNPCLAFSSYFCTRRRYKAKAGMVLAYSWIISVFFIVMNAKLMRVVQQGEAFAVQSQKSENGQVFQNFLLTDFYKFNWFEISVISSTDSKLLELVLNY